MSFQAYLDNIEDKTGLTPRQFIDARQKGFEPSTKAGPIVEWLKADYGWAADTPWRWSTSSPRGRHQHQARRLEGVHRDESETLWLEGKATKP